MTAIVKDWTNIYQNQLLIGFYKKRGKALVIPHIVNYLDKLMNIPSSDPIRVLDIGCGKGDLLKVLSQIAANKENQREILLYGLDREEKLIQKAIKEGFPKDRLFQKNITAVSQEDFGVKFDLITSLNTVHEVFSDMLGSGHRSFPLKKYQESQKKIRELIKRLTGFLTDEGAIVIYDGLAPNNLLEKVKFVLNSQETKRLLDEMVANNKIWKMSYALDDSGTVEMTQADFVRFISTLKYLDSNLWKIEQYENYYYFSEEEFEEAIESSGLTLESKVLVNNDLNIWQNCVTMKNPFSFPYKSILIMGSNKNGLF
jgi:SAM-dependent methyltransferase